MSKGSATAAKNQVGINNAYAKSFNKSGIADRKTLFPFLQGEVTDPQGYGADTVNKMLTQGGQSVSGATGAANEAATLNASRTGNTAALPGLIGSNARSAMKQNSDNALSVALKDADLKQKQQQLGAAGLGNLYGEDTDAVLKSLGLTNQSIGEWTQGKAAANQGINDMMKTIGGLSLGSAGLGLKAAGLPV